MNRIIAVVALAFACGGESRAPSPWARQHTEADIKDLIVACGKGIHPRASPPPHYEAVYEVDAPVPYSVRCVADWGAEKRRLEFLRVAIVARGAMHVTTEDILPIAEFVLRELPPGPRAIALRVATGKEQKVTSGPFTIDGGFPNGTGMWALGVELAQ